MTTQFESIAFDDLRKQPEIAAKLAGTICERHHLTGSCQRIHAGSQLLFRTQSHRVIKIFSPVDHEACRNEALFLQALHNQLAIHTPALETQNAMGSYPYLIMEALSGQPLETIWPSLSDSDKRSLVQQLGTATQQLHSLPTKRFKSAPLNWCSFIENQRKRVLLHHKATGLAPAWLDQIEDYISPLPASIINPEDLVPLHTELMLDHVFAQQINNKWQITGLLDFEPSMIGHREYDFAAVGIFITQGNPHLFNRYLSSYGYPQSDLTEELTRRIMIFLLLHRYSNLTWFLSLIPHQNKFSKLNQLAHYWYDLQPVIALASEVSNSQSLPK